MPLVLRVLKTESGYRRHWSAPSRFKVFGGIPSIFLPGMPLGNSTSMPKLIAFDSINVPVQLTVHERTFHGIYQQLRGLVPATGVQLMVIVESMDPGYKHEQDTYGDISMKASVARLSLPGELAMANVMRQKNMTRHDPKYDIRCVWSNQVCKCFVATSTSRTVLTQLEQLEFPRLGPPPTRGPLVAPGVLIHGDKIIYCFNE